MFNKLISRLRKDGEGHPLSSEQRLAETIAEIRAEDGEGAVLDVDHWLNEVEELVALSDGAALRRAVQRLDEFVQGPLQATWSAWFNSADRLYLSDKGWQTLINHYTAVGKAYALCLADPELPKLDDKTLLPCFAARAMRAMVQGKKLQRLRYRAPDPAWWDKAGQLLTWARERGASQAQVSVYPGEEPSSVWREYLIGVYLELAPLDGLLQRQIEVADAVLRKCSGALVVRAQPVGNELYCLDPSSPQGPIRHEDGIRLRSVMSGWTACAPRLFAWLRKCGRRARGLCRIGWPMPICLQRTCATSCTVWPWPGRPMRRSARLSAAMSMAKLSPSSVSVWCGAWLPVRRWRVPADAWITIPIST
jgi:hypothetical protein